MKWSRSLLGLAFLVGCNGGEHAASDAGAAPVSSAASSASELNPVTDVPSDAGLSPDSEVAAAPRDESPRAAFVRWLTEHLPPGGEVIDEGGSPVRVRHRVGPNESPASIAKAYLPFTDVYMEDDLLFEIAKNFAQAGKSLEIPHLITEPLKSADDERLGWPSDKPMTGIYIGGNWARTTWVTTLERMKARGMNIVVLDAKDYMGPVVYPSKVPLVLEMGASKGAPIRDLARTIRFAHARGIYVALRIPCFHDPLAQKAAPKLSLKFVTTHKPADYDWLDPTNEDAQNYAIDLAKEGMDAGADEIQLDYVRFPVQDGLRYIDLPPHGVIRTEIIRDFVKRVHAVTKPRKVALSLDIFGVTTTGTRADVEALGQDVGLLAAECEALSPMVYPSHYTNGFMGFKEPGAHPEIIAVGTKGAIDQIEAAKRAFAKAHPGETKQWAIVRSWLQAFNWNSPGYNSTYVANEAKEAARGGGTGWLLWDPSCQYATAWNAFPKRAP